MKKRIRLLYTIKQSVRNDIRKLTKRLVDKDYNDSEVAGIVAKLDKLYNKEERVEKILSDI